jgi:adenosylcobinamide kinase / adenosylcobinamide-phosphate guanylyltransferase
MHKPGKITLITGGSRSGKSSYALSLARPYKKPIFLATAEPFDGEMSDRIRRHQAERGDTFITIEEPVELAKALASLPAGTEVVLIDCLTVWLGNLMHKQGLREEPYAEVEALYVFLKNPPCDLIFVTNEVGSGIIPADALTRAYRDHAGWLNQEVARRADQVVLVTCGLPLTLKGT